MIVLDLVYSEDLMNVRLQTKEKNTNEIMENAMDNIVEIGDILSNKFQKALHNQRKSAYLIQL